MDSQTKYARSLKFLALATLALLLAALLVAAAPTAFAQGGKNSNPGILPPQSNPHGLSYGEWSVKWYQWIYSIPADKNPWLDTTGANAAVGQSGHVWFLTGVVCPYEDPRQICTATGATVTRAVTIPAGTMLFFPVANTQLDNLGVSPGDELTARQLQELAKQYQDSVVSMSVVIDGVPVQGLDPVGSPYRITAPVFSYTIPENNVYLALVPPEIRGAFGPQKVDPAVSDGVFLMLAPLSAHRQHTVHLAAQFASGFSLDVTYLITVK